VILQGGQHTLAGISEKTPNQIERIEERRPPSNRAGRKRSARISANEASTTTATNRKGKAISHNKGNKTRTSNAIGQQATSRINQLMNIISSFIPEVTLGLFRALSTPVKAARTERCFNPSQSASQPERRARPPRPLGTLPQATACPCSACESRQSLPVPPPRPRARS